MIRLAVTNKKGGVSKTTTALNLSAALAKSGYKVLMVDLDSQANLTESVQHKKPADTLANYVLNGVPKAANYWNIANPVLSDGEPVYDELLWIAPGYDDWTLVEKKVGNLEDWQDLFKDNFGFLDHFDFIIFDCPPSMGALTVNALVYSDYYLVPLKPEPYSLKGIRDLFDKVERLSAFNPRLKCAGVFLSWFNQGTNKILHKTVYELLQEELGSLLMKTSIRENIALSEAITQSEDVFTYSPTSNGANDYMALSQELLERINRK